MMSCTIREEERIFGLLHDGNKQNQAGFAYANPEYTLKAIQEMCGMFEEGLRDHNEARTPHHSFPQPQAETTLD